MKKKYITKGVIQEFLEIETHEEMEKFLLLFEDKTLKRFYDTIKGIDWLFSGSNNTHTGIITLGKKSNDYMLIPGQYKEEYTIRVGYIASEIRNRVIENLGI